VLPPDSDRVAAGLGDRPERGLLPPVSDRVAAERNGMLDPHLNDWWSRKRLTRLRYRDSSLSGAGVSLRVILPALKALNLTWYSTVYGEYDDNLLLLGCDKNAASQFDRIEYKETSPLQAVCQDTFLNEYVLTDHIRSALGIRFEENDCIINREESIACQVYVHDNCFFYVRPVDEALSGKLLNCILEQHSFYLGQEIDWSGVLADLVRHLLALGELDMQSDPGGRCLWIPQLEKKWFPFWKAFRPGTVLIENGQARFRVGI